MTFSTYKSYALLHFRDFLYSHVSFLALQVLFEKQNVQVPPSKRRKLNQSDTRDFTEDVTLTSEDFANLQASYVLSPPLYKH